MSCKSAIYTANTTPATLTLTTAQPIATLSLGTVIRRFGQNVQLSGNGILVGGAGYYDVDASVTLTPAAAGEYTVTLYQDGAAVPGATQTVTAAAAAAIAFNIPALVRLQCCNSSATLTLVLSTTAALPATVVANNVAVVVEKI